MNPQKRATEWVELYGDLLYQFALNRTGSVEVAEDLVQETLISAFKSLETFKEEASDKTWLMRILRNKIIDYYRKSRTRKNGDGVSQKREVHFTTFFNEDGAWDSEHLVQSWDSTPDEQAENAQLKEALHNCIENLNGKGAAAFRMKYIDDEESEEICKVLDITSSNYWVLIHRAKLQLRECIDHSYFDELRKYNAH